MKSLLLNYFLLVFVAIASILLASSVANELSEYRKGKRERKHGKK